MMQEVPDTIQTEAAAPRKPYEAPKVTRVPLRPEEAVLGACKVSGNTCLLGSTLGS